jgi:hypothetical protein
MNNKSKIKDIEIQSPYLSNVLKVMCDFIGAPYSIIDDNQMDAWYTKYKWTSETENIFKTWMTNYLFNNKGARQEIMARPIKNKKIIKNVVNSFILNYGWAYK